MAAHWYESFDVCTTIVQLLAGRWNSIALNHASAEIEVGTGSNESNALKFTATDDNNIVALLAKTIPASGTLYKGFRFECSALPNAGNAFNISRFRDAGVAQCELRLNSDGTLAIARNGTVLGTTSYALNPGIGYFIEWTITFHNTLGLAQIKVNEIVRLNLSNQDTQNTANATANEIVLCMENLISNDSGGKYFRFDNVYAYDDQGAEDNTFAGSIDIIASHPDGNGNQNDFTVDGAVNNFQAVDDPSPDDDTTIVKSSALNAIDLYTMEDVGTSGTVKGVQVNLYCKKSDAGPRSIAPIIRHSAANYVGTNQNPSEDYAYLSQIYPLNPGTGIAWTPTNVNNAEFGGKITV